MHSLLILFWFAQDNTVNKETPIFKRFPWPGSLSPLYRMQYYNLLNLSSDVAPSPGIYPLAVLLDIVRDGGGAGIKWVVCVQLHGCYCTDPAGPTSVKEKNNSMGSRQFGIKSHCGPSIFYFDFFS